MACPINLVCVKIQLEEIEIGQVIEVFLVSGEPARNVPARLNKDKAMEHHNVFSRQALTDTDKIGHPKLVA